MKWLALSILFCCADAQAQGLSKGRLLRQIFTARSITGNAAGEDDHRHVTVYLPPGYEAGSKRYPVIYYLHGYGWNDSSNTAWLGLDTLMDRAIERGVIRPVIVVVPDSWTSFEGSFYANSNYTGRWADYIGRDVVEWTDAHFRTLADRDSRGVTGISMGGHGSLKMGMLFPEVFGAVYAETPASLYWSDGINPRIDAFRLIADGDSAKIMESFAAKLMLDFGRTWSPDRAHGPWGAGLPVRYINGAAVIDSAIVAKWEANFPTGMIGTHLSALKRLNALKIDWGRNDEARQNPVLCRDFSKRLEWFGVKHFAEEYLGGHADMLPGIDGRVYTEVLPFFERWLAFERPAQPVDVKAENLRILQEEKSHVMRLMECKEIIYRPRGKKELGTLKRAMQLVNALMEMKMDPVEWRRYMGKIKFKTDTVCRINGRLLMMNANIYTGYCLLEAKFVFIDSIPVERKIWIKGPKCMCLSTAMDLADYKVLEDIYVPTLNHRISFRYFMDIIVQSLDTVSLRQIAARHPEDNFFIDPMFAKMYDPDSSCCYGNADRDMIRLIKEGRFDLIQDMVFSPNYFFAINAMEAVIYLSSVGKIELTDRLKERIGRLKAGRSDFFKGASDVFVEVGGYADLKMTDARVIEKYSKAL